MSTERDAQPPAAERYVLARHGLPLPRTAASVPRAPWLPAAVRSRALPSQARALPLPPLVEPQWDEAFPPEPAAPLPSPMPQVAGSIAPESSPQANAVPPGHAPGAPVSIEPRRELAAAQDRPTADPRSTPAEATAVAPAQRRPTEVATSAAPAPAQPPDRRDQESADPVPDSFVVYEHRAPHSDQATETAAMAAPGPVVPALPSHPTRAADSAFRSERTSTPVPAERIAPREVVSAASDTVPAPTRVKPSPSSAAAITLPPVGDAPVQTMGAPFMVVASATAPAPVAPGARSVAPKPLGAAELAALHSPAPAPRSVRIDRVQVAVQVAAASAPRPSGAPAAIPSTPSRAPAMQGVRNPWSSYFTRRD